MFDKLIKVGDQFYLLDTSVLKSFEKMEMTYIPTMPTPLPDFKFRTFIDNAPILQPSAFIYTSTYESEPEWSFAFLFPLGKIGYKRRR